jgi:hypothetical protein
LPDVGIKISVNVVMVVVVIMIVIMPVIVVVSMVAYAHCQGWRGVPQFSPVGPGKYNLRVALLDATNMNMVTVVPELYDAVWCAGSQGYLKIVYRRIGQVPISAIGGDDDGA